MVNINLLNCQMSKYQKWIEPSYFKGFTINVWDSYNEREVSQQDFNNLKETGANLVILETQGSMDELPPYGPNIYYQEGEYIILYIEKLDQMVQYARDAGLMYVIAVRDGPGRIDVSEPGESSVWTNLVEQQLYGKMLKEMAIRYLPDSLFVGMVLTVEPNPLGELWEPPIQTMDSALKANNIDLNRIQSIWIDSVRTIDNELPLIVGGTHASHPEYFSLVTKQNDNKIIYTTHLYNPANFSHAYEPYIENYPGDYWCVRLGDNITLNKSNLKNELYKPVYDFQKKHNIPILVGEFGLRLPQNGGEQYLSDIASIACESGWHYAIWSFNGGPEFNYRILDSIYGTNYWKLVQSFMKCNNTLVDENKYNNNLITPNPFSESTTINYELHTAEKVKIDIFNSLGSKITTLVDEWQEAGSHNAVFGVETNCNVSLESGLYYYMIQIGEKIESGKMVLIR